MKLKNILSAAIAIIFLVNSSVAQGVHRHSMMKGKGTCSFKANGQVYTTDSTQTKCWTTANVPLAMLWANGNGLSVSWQIQNMQGLGTYKIDKDKKGSINFTIANKTYWVRSSGNYLNITVTIIKDFYTVKLLSGSFEGVLEDKDGHKILVTEGKFTTQGI